MFTAFAQTAVGPLINPGVDNVFLLTVNVLAELVPQMLLVVTLKVPWAVKLLPYVTWMLLVPWPVVMAAPEGAVQL